MLEAGLAEFTERGFAAVTVDDIARRADTSHGAFYMYFANKDDFFGVLASVALDAMSGLAEEFPVITAGDAGKAALRKWVDAFCATYAAHAAVIQTLSQADLVGQAVWEDGVATLFRLADAIAAGMTAAVHRAADGVRVPPRAERLCAVALLMMLERVNYLLNSDVVLAKHEMVDCLTDIIHGAFPAPD